MSLLKALNLLPVSSKAKPGASATSATKSTTAVDASGKSAVGNSATDRGVEDDNRITTPQGTTPALIQKAIADTARRVEDRALSLTTQFMALVLKACDDFRGYSKPRLKKLDDEVTAGDLLQGLATAAIGMIGGELAGKVANKIGKALVDKMVDVFKTEVPKAANPKSKDLADLTSAVDALVRALGDKALLSSAVTETIGKRCGRHH